MTNIYASIRDEIRSRGPISFARFMELALYSPGEGYYERPVSPGKAGDFYTSVSVGPLLGELLATQFADWLDALPAGRHQLVEAGAHDGRLASDILRWFQSHRPELLESLEYWILEPSEARRNIQGTRLAEFSAKIRWFRDWSEVPATGVAGVIFSNELLDAMPVHRIGWDAMQRKWFEWSVSFGQDEFIWSREAPAAGLPESLLAEFTGLPAELLAVLPDGFSTEISPAAEAWWAAAARALKSGVLMTLDYGLEADEFFSPVRIHGTLRAYQNHRPSANVLAQPGEQDITAHLNFTRLERAGFAEGLRPGEFVTQSRFLIEIVEGFSRAGTLPLDWKADRVRQFQTLTHPEHLGQKFRVLWQARGD